MNSDQEALLAEAKAAALHSYSPYSQFRVGAAVLTDDGSVFRGVNVENASSNLGICAERVAIANARTNSHSNIIGIAVFCLDAHQSEDGHFNDQQTLPCGACLQWITELASGAWIVTNGVTESLMVTDLLPRPFRISE